jgi:hypothetical protein
MSQLGQQELMEAGPRRRIIVPEGHGAWYGVDPSTLRVSVAFVAQDGARGVATCPFPRAEGPERLAEIYTHTRQFWWRLMQAGWPTPGLVMVEQPSGKMENPNLSYAVGVILAATWAGVHDSFDGGAIETCTSSWWKKRACGRGNIYKPKKRAEEYEVVTWARENGYTGISWDEADAWGIAEAARREVELVQR